MNKSNLSAVGGNTFPVKEQLKSKCGAKWDRDARVWMVPANKLEEAIAIVRGNAPVFKSTIQLSRADIKWSDEQAKFVAWFKKGPCAGNYVVRARAGSGKTFNIIGGISEAPEDTIIYLVFGAKNRDEAVEKISDPRVQVLSLHQAGFRFGIKKFWPKSHIDRDSANAVEWDRIRTACGGDVPDEVGAELFKLVGFAKNVFCGVPSQDDCEALAIDRDIDCEAYEAPEDGGWNISRLAEVCIEVLKLTCIPDSQNRICFNDMVWLPVAMNWISPRFALVVVDECQDQNAPQLAIARGLCAGRIAVVGDDRQAIYHFRGACQNGISLMKEQLNAEEQGLTYTRRCAKAIVREAQVLVPDYKAFDDAAEGLVDELPFSKLQEQARRGDAILSRLNAPLVPLWLSFIRKGVACKIEGKEQVGAFLNLIKKFKARSIPEVVRKAEAWGDRMIARLGKLTDAKSAKAELIRDQVATIIAIVDGLGSVAEIEPRVQSIFADTGKEGNNAVILSTVHKAKGLEWNRVFIICPTFKFKGGQEDNIKYVAITRAKNHLTYVEGRLIVLPVSDNNQ
jgi:hypothetical protein